MRMSLRRARNGSASIPFRRGRNERIFIHYRQRFHTSSPAVSYTIASGFMNHRQRFHTSSPAIGNDRDRCRQQQRQRPQRRRAGGKDGQQTCQPPSARRALSCLPARRAPRTSARPARPALLRPELTRAGEAGRAIIRVADQPGMASRHPVLYRSGPAGTDPGRPGLTEDSKEGERARERGRERDRKGERDPGRPAPV
jgi:hypothetical protein